MQSEKKCHDTVYVWMFYINSNCTIHHIIQQHTALNTAFKAMGLIVPAASSKQEDGANIQYNFTVEKQGCFPRRRLNLVWNISKKIYFLLQNMPPNSPGTKIIFLETLQQDV